MEIIEKLEWRYAAKAMNGEKVPAEKIDRILEAARLAPSAFGLQPFEIISVSNPDLLAQLLPVAYNQNQVKGCSHLLVFAAWDNYTPERIEAFIEHVAKERNVTVESLAAYRQALLNSFDPAKPEINFIHAAKQAYIGLGVTIVAAATEDVDGSPMEGFDAAGMDTLLGLRERGLRSAVILALGYRDTENDRFANLKKVRADRTRFITHLN
ncbi:MAG: nitroreductase family protein [Niabella sp.]|nr:nitroreductase family protein [Niabella sp.]